MGAYIDNITRLDLSTVHT